MKIDPTIAAAIIAAFVAAIAGILNFFMSVHRNRQDGITKYRMEWIENVRNEFTTIFGWAYYSVGDQSKVTANSLEPVRNAVWKISLFLNVRDEYDSQILNECFRYLEMLEPVHALFAHVGQNPKEATKVITKLKASKEFQGAEERKQEFLKLVRVYLKTEWTRVKVDSSIVKFRYWFCWRPFKGFIAEKAIEKFKADYIKLDAGVDYTPKK